MAKIIIHGGCGKRESADSTFEEYHTHLSSIIPKSYDYLVHTDDATLTAVFAARLLESDPTLIIHTFCAGTGSRVQQDGHIRMSASIMDSVRNRFAGVINVEAIEHPIEVAHKLMDMDEKEQLCSVLAGEPASEWAHEGPCRLPRYNPMTEARWREYVERKKEDKSGTIGAVVLDRRGRICAVTSTGGRGFETPGRVSDTPTVAANFASHLMGVSCTGIGEHIINSAIAVKLHTRVQDGAQLQVAADRTIGESERRGDYLGFIALDAKGAIVTAQTSVAQTLYAYHDGIEAKTFYHCMPQASNL